MLDMYRLTMKWQLAAHFVTCVNILLIIISAGIRPRKGITCRFSLAYSIIIGYLCLQCTLFGFAYNDLSKRMPPLDKLSTLMIDHIWSPMGTSFIIWLFLAHALAANDAIRKRSPEHRVASAINPSILLRFISIGIFSVLCLDSIIGVHNIPSDPLVMVTMLFALSGIVGELVYYRVKLNYVPILSSTWAWYIGTWIGMWLLAVI